jgi:modification methylase
VAIALPESTESVEVEPEIERNLLAFLPESLRRGKLEQSEIPAIAKDRKLIGQIREALRSLPTRHEAHHADARKMDFLSTDSVHLVVTSPPYWTLKEYDDSDAQLGHVADYSNFLDQLDEVWRHCHRALVPGGRVVCVVGDVCLSRRKNAGRHTVVPLHASIQERCRLIGFDNLAPIIWHKIANANFEAGGGGFLGKPYEPNAVIKNDIEFVLMQRKHGGYRSPDSATRLLSVIAEDEQRLWFQQIWTGVTGASTREHPAPYPVELVERLIRMFSFAGDTVLDPFSGTFTTSVAAAKCGRNSIGVEVQPRYFEMGVKRLQRETAGLFAAAEVRVINS